MSRSCRLRGDPILAAVENAMEAIEQRRGRKRKGSVEDLPAIQHAIDWIASQVQKGDPVSAEQGLLRLIRRQGERSRLRDIVKTLTDVADQAFKSNQLDFTDLMLLAIERIGRDDAAVSGVRAQVLRKRNRYEEALAHLKATMERFPTDEFARGIYAETLRDLGRYEEAQAHLKLTMEQFPTNEVVPNIYAETLRDLGRYEEALAHLNATMERFPTNEVIPGSTRRRCATLAATRRRWRI